MSYPSSHRSRPLAARSRAAALALALPVALAGALPPARAQNPSEVVVSASRIAEPGDTAAASTRVITRAEIDALQAADLPAILRSLVAVDVAQSGPPGSLTTIFLRGADSRQVLLLVDGIPLNRADFGLASWQSLPLAQIERVEVVRGNLSPVWGAPAVGGVVNIITRGGGEGGWSLSGGTQGRAAASVHTGTSWGRGATATRLSGGVSSSRSAGYDARATGPHNTDRDGHRLSGGSLRLEQGWAEGHRTTLSALTSDNRSDYDDTAGSLTATDRLRTRVQAWGLSSQHRLSGTVGLDLDGGRTLERFEDPTGYTRSGRNEVQQLQAQTRWQGLGGQVAAALETRREHFASSTEAATRRSTDSARLGWTARYAVWPAAPLDVQALLRHDRSNAFGSADTALLHAAVALSPQWRVSAQASTGFSLPSFIDQVYAAPGVVLQPERSRNAEAALQWQRGAERVRLTVFQQRQRDRIGYDDTYAAVNIARASNEGVELSGRTALPLGELGLDLIRQNPVNEDTGRALARRARDTAVLNWQLARGVWRTGLWLRQAGPRFDSDFSDAVTPRRRTLDATLALRLDDGWTLGLRGENLTGSTVPEVRGYTPAPRGWTVTLRGSL